MAEISVEPMMGKGSSFSSRIPMPFRDVDNRRNDESSGVVWVEHNDSKKALDIAKRKFAVEEGDHITLLNVYHSL